MNTGTVSHRNSSIDIARGLGILLVVLGHAIRPEMLNTPWCEFLFLAIYSLHMPLFFVLSGYTFALTYRKYLAAPATFLQKRTKSLLIPLLSWAAIVYCFFFIASLVPTVASLLAAASFELVNPLRYLYLMLVWENPYAAHLWYLWVLLVITLIAYGFAKLSKDAPSWKPTFTVLAIVCHLLAICLPMPTAIDKILLYPLYFSVGMLLADTAVLLTIKSPLSIVATIVSAAILIGIALLTTLDLLPQKGIYGVMQEIVKTVAVLPVIVGILQLCDKGVALIPMQKLGRDSFAIYLLHQPFCCGMAGILFYDVLRLPIPVVLIICTMLSFLFPFAVVALSRRVKWIGRVTGALLNI
jgi:fucose 4-O-acetylase-like acetyltransferase